MKDRVIGSSGDRAKDEAFVEIPIVERCPACLDPESPCRCNMDYLHCQAELYANWMRWRERGRFEAQQLEASSLGASA
jgi:hypothetical protein